MRKRKINVGYVQMMERTSRGLTIIGQPVTMALGKQIRKELFGDNPSVILYPSVAPKKLKKVM